MLLTPAAPRRTDKVCRADWDAQHYNRDFAYRQEIRMHLKKGKHVSKENSQSRRDRRSLKRKTIEFRNLPPMADVKTIHDTPEARLGSLPRYAIIQKDLTPRQVLGRL